jgi:8-oxo-dGTP diphosphatase
MDEQMDTLEHEATEQVRLTADVVLFGEFDGAAWVLLIERGWDPFKGHLALPGGHVDAGETAEDAAHRELAEETGIRVGALTQVGAYAAPGRDPRGRYVTFAYTARMPRRVEPVAGDDAVRAEWVRLDEILSGTRRIAFDHDLIIRNALDHVTFYTA